MRDYLSDAQFDHFLKELEKIGTTGDNAIEEDSEEKAAKEWQKLLGNRFPVFEDPDDKKRLRISLVIMSSRGYAGINFQQKVYPLHGEGLLGVREKM